MRGAATGAPFNARVIVIRPLACKPPGSQRLLYRQPAYLPCTDDTIPAADAVQYGFWRWEIEVNFREEKTILGAGEAQLRDPRFVENAPEGHYRTICVPIPSSVNSSSSKLCGRLPSRM